MEKRKRYNYEIRDESGKLLRTDDFIASDIEEAFMKEMLMSKKWKGSKIKLSGIEDNLTEEEINRAIAEGGI